ncbi:MAG: 50S ribosomal protein L2 [Patescibacteria group bacterium]
MTKKLIKKLVDIKKKKSGRDSRGHVSVRHQGGQHKRFVRIIDTHRDKKEIEAKVISIEYDPNRGANIALVCYLDGEKRYILAPAKLKKDGIIIASENAPIEPGNALPLSQVPVGVPIHNLEILPGKGGQMVRGAGNQAFVQGRSGDQISVKLPSGEIRLFLANCWATIGQLSNVAHGSRKLSKAGDKRHRGVRPTVRGVAQHPDSHPHGGGEGRSPVGMKSPKTPWGKRVGRRTRKKNKHSNSLIVKRRK